MEQPLQDRRVAGPVGTPCGAASISPDEFRRAFRRLASSVTIVTVKAGERVHGLTVSAFAPVSPSPPLVTVLIDSEHTAHRLLERPGAVFAVNLLGRAHRALSDRFAWLKTGDRFAEGRWTSAATGAPVLADACAWLDCTIHERVRAGTHTIYIGEIRAADVPGPEEPLVYWNRDYRPLGT